MSKKKQFFFLILIIFLAAILRFYKLTEVPAGFDWDEAALGYNAYSILKTGKDEYGVKFPLILRSFEDYKPPFYAYLAIPSIKLFGLNEFAVRFPSALLGTLSVLLVYFLTRELFPKFSSRFYLLVAFFMAICPWSIQFSRMAFEANISLFLTILGTWFFLKSLKNGKWLIFSSLSLILTTYTYHSAKVFTPILILGLCLYFWKNLWQQKKYLLVFLILSFILVLPLIRTILSKEGITRFQGINIFADQTFLEPSIKKMEEDIKDKIPLAKLWHNRRLEYFFAFAKGYFSHFDFNFLFLEGGLSPMHHPPGMGQLYLLEIPFIILGIFLLTQIKGPARFLLFFWFLVAPLASAPTRDVPNAVRTLIFLPTFPIFTALGLEKFFEFKKRILLMISFLLLGFNFLYYLHCYFVDLPRDYSSYWQYGYKEAINEVLKREKDYEKIIVSTNLDQPHIFFLFYTKYDPKVYLQEGGTKLNWIRTGEYQFGKYQFTKIDWEKQKENNYLFLGVPNDFPPEVSILKTVKFLNGQEAIKIVDRR